MKHIFIVKQQYLYRMQDLASNIFSFCFNHDYDFLIIEAGTDGDVEEIAKKYKMEDAIIYAIGNDKDLHLVLNAIVGGNAKLGIIPLGNDNDFYLSLDTYASDLVSTNVMQVNDSFGINAFLIGLQAEMANTKNPFDAFATFLGYKNQVMGINNYFEKMLSLAFFNGSFYHGREVSCAQIHNDIIRVITSVNMSKIESLVFLLEFLLGKHEKNPQVSIFTTDQKVCIEGMNHLAGWLDGELMSDTEYLIVPHASAITVVNNRQLIRELKK